MAHVISFLLFLIFFGITPDVLYAESGSPHSINTNPKQIIPDIDPIRLPLIAEEEITLRFRLKQENGTVLSSDRLYRSDDSKIHLIAIDATYTDFRFLSPTLEKNNIFHVTFTPTTSGPYRFYIDVQGKGTPPLFTGTFDLGGPFISSFPDDTPLSSRASMDGYDFALLCSSDETLPLNTRSDLRIQITKNDQPVTNLEPIMEEFGHMVAFNPETGQIIHLTPSEIRTSSLRNSVKSELHFQITPNFSGKIPLFLTVQINNTLHTAPFVLGVDDIP